MTKPTTPFPTNGYYAPEYFCDRTSEVRRLYEAASAGSSTTLVSLRRMGKSALLHHFAHVYARKVATVYVDLYPTNSLQQLEDALATQVAATLYSAGKKARELVLDFARSLGATIKFAADGVPSLQIASSRLEEQHSALATLFSYTESYSKPVVIVFDEFQQIALYAEQNVEAAIRAQMQLLKNTTFVFAGSNKSLLSAMFSDHKRPLYQSTQHIHLNAIALTEYSNFITSMFATAGRTIDAEACEFVYSECEGRTFHIQQICQRMYVLNTKHITVAEARHVLEGILAEQTHLFERFRSMLSTAQWNVLTTIANQRVIQAPYSAEMLRMYGASSQSTAQRVYSALEEKELIYQDAKGYHVEDPFLSRWICKTFPR